MKYLVSQGAVWGLTQDLSGAVNLTALDPAFGSDLRGPIALGRDEAAKRAAKLMEGAALTDPENAEA